LYGVPLLLVVVLPINVLPIKNKQPSFLRGMNSGNDSAAIEKGGKEERMRDEG
jgi:hypothetical protein